MNYCAAQMGINYSYAGIISSKKFVRENPDTTMRFTRAYLEALALLLRDKPTAVRIVEKYSRISDRTVLDKAYDVFAKHWRHTPLPDREGVRAIIEDLAAQEPKAKNAEPENFIDPTFVRKAA